MKFTKCTAAQIKLNDGMTVARDGLLTVEVRYSVSHNGYKICFFNGDECTKVLSNGFTSLSKVWAKLAPMLEPKDL
jgi:hypothetical protein